MGIFDLFKKKSADEEMKIQAQQIENNTLNDERFKEESNKPFSMTIEDVFTISGRGTVVVGTIESGIIRFNDIVLIERIGRTTTIKGIEAFRKQMDVAQAGDNVGLLLEDIGRDEVQRGDKLKK